MKTQLELLKDLVNDYKDKKMSALVGAGFSKNVSDKFLNWSDLLVDMYKVVYSNKLETYFQNYLNTHVDETTKISREKIINSYVKDNIDNENLLELVSKYIIKNGYRECVDSYIEARIPRVDKDNDNKTFLELRGCKEVIEDDSFSAHLELLKCDKFLNIYTTNYDKLIEYTNKHFVNNKVFNDDPITTSIQLSNQISNQNIIKIHGDLRDKPDQEFRFDNDHDLCYIIAQEDYDTYSKKHEAFSYMMRMAMLSGKFCLIGFSGQDANYLAWIKWMRDVIVNDSKPDNKKIYLISIDKKKCVENAESTKSLELFNRNYHIGVINLCDKDILSEIGLLLNNSNSEEDISYGYKDILTAFLKYLNTQSINAAESQSLPSDMVMSNAKGFANSINGSNNNVILNKETSYKQLWLKASEKKRAHEPLNEIRKAIIEVKQKNRFTKIVYPQESFLMRCTINPIETIDEASLFSLAISDMGYIPDFYKVSESENNLLNNCELWQFLTIRNETVTGSDSSLDQSTDIIQNENVLRKLFNLDFTGFKRTIEEWHPNEYWKINYAQMSSLYIDKAKTSLGILNAYIKDEDLDSQEKLYAMNVVNYLARQIPYPYVCDEYYDKGYNGLGDLQEAILMNFHKKTETPRMLDWIGTTYNIQSYDTEMFNGMRLVQFLMNTGLNPNYYGTYFLSIENWYQIAHSLLRNYPYPCYYYSCQYQDKDALRRIGQEFAYCRSLESINEDLLCKSLKAINNSDTPNLFIKGLLLISARLYIVVDEKIWFPLFTRSILNPAMDRLQNVDSFDEEKENLRMGIGNLNDSKNIKIVLNTLLVNFEKSPEYICSLISSNLLVDSILRWNKKTISLLETIIKTSKPGASAELIYVLNEAKKVPCELIDLLKCRLKQLSSEDYPQNPITLIYMFLVCKDDPELYSKIMNIILQKDLWHCGLSEDGQVYSNPQYIRLNLLQDKIKWTDEEFNLIRNNLDANIKKISKSTFSIKTDFFFRNHLLQYVLDVKSFIDTLPFSQKKILEDSYSVICDMIDKDGFNYSLELELLSEQSADVSNAIKQVGYSIKYNGIKANVDNINLLLDRALMIQKSASKTNLGLLAQIVKEHYRDMKKFGFINKLLSILKIYRSVDLYERQLDLYWTYNRLYAIAHRMKDDYSKNEDVDFWLTDPWVLKFVRSK